MEKGKQMLGSQFFRLKNIYMLLLLLTTISYVYLFSIYPIRNADSGVWIPMTIDFFENMNQSIGVHRPLFGFLSHLIYRFLILLNINNLNLTYASGINDQLVSISGNEAIAYVSWMILNYFFYVAIVILAFKASYELIRNKRVAFLFSILVLVSTELTNWMTNLAIMVPGVFIIYLSIYLLIKFKNYDSKKQVKASVIFGLIFGILMLGKAEYQILIFLTLVTVTLYRSQLRNLLFFVLSHFIPLLTWITYLIFFKSGYRVYEVVRDDYSIFEYWKRNFQINSLQSYLDFFFILPFQGLIGSVPFGLGILCTISLFVTVGFFINNYLGKVLIIYLYSTALFLFIVNFSMARHTFEYAPISYLGISLGLNSMYERTFVSRNLYIKSIYIIFVILAILFIYYFNLKRNLSGVNPIDRGLPFI